MYNIQFKDRTRGLKGLREQNHNEMHNKDIKTVTNTWYS